MPRLDSYMDVFEATFNTVINSHLFLWRIENVRSTEFNKVNPQTIQCASMLVVLVTVETTSNHLFVVRWAGFAPPLQMDRSQHDLK